MSIENENGNEKQPIRWTARAKKLAAGVAITASTLGIAATAEEQQPKTVGEQTVMVMQGDTIDGITMAQVAGGENHIDVVRTEVLNNPDNADVFKNKQLDPGEDVEFPEKVTD